MYLWIGGDIVPTEDNRANFESGAMEALLQNSLFDTLNAGDHRIFNLETPLADTPSPIVKAGPNLLASRACANGLRSMNISAVCLANNHLMDHGANGLDATLQALDGIPAFGWAQPESGAHASLSLGNVALYACAEREFGAADENTPGAITYDPLTSFDEVAALSQTHARVIVLYHGGLERYRYPTPNLRRICRKFVDRGADLVICQHSHAVGCQEEYAGGRIIYGQGNFLFNRFDDEYWHTGLLIGIDTESWDIALRPLERCGNGVALSDDKSILEGFYARSEQIKQPGFVEEAFRKRARQADYEKKLFGRLGRYVRKLKIAGRLMDRRSAAGIVNMLDCDTHRELAAEMLRLKYIDS